MSSRAVRELFLLRVLAVRYRGQASAGTERLENSSANAILVAGAHTQQERRREVWAAGNEDVGDNCHSSEAALCSARCHGAQARADVSFNPDRGRGSGRHYLPLCE